MQLFKECITNGPRLEQEQANPELFKRCIALNLSKGLPERRLQLLGRKLFKQCALNNPVSSVDLQNRVNLINNRLNATEQDDWKMTVDDFVKLCKLHDSPKHINKHYYNLLASDDTTLENIEALEQVSNLPSQVVDETMQYLEDKDQGKKMTIESFFINAENPDNFFDAHELLFLLKNLQDNAETIGASLAHDAVYKDNLINNMVAAYIKSAIGQRGLQLLDTNPKVLKAIEKLSVSLHKTINSNLGKDLTAQEKTVLNRKLALTNLKNFYPDQALTQQQKDKIVNFLLDHLKLLARAIADNEYIMKSASFQAVDFVKRIVEANLFVDASFLLDDREFIEALDEAVEEVKQSFLQNDDPIARQGFIINQRSLNPQNTQEYQEFVDNLSASEKYNYDMYIETMIIPVDDDKLLELESNLVDMFLTTYSATVQSAYKKA